MSRFYKISFIPFLTCLLFVLTACEEVKQIQANVEADNQLSTQALRQLEPSQEPSRALTVDKTPWYGATAIPIKNGEPLPASLTQDDSLVLTFDQGQTIQEIARLLQSVTNIRVRVITPTLAQAERAFAAGNDDLFLPINGREVSGGRIVWQGGLDDLLEQVSDTFDAHWRFDGRSIFIEQEVTRIFTFHALATSINVDSGLESGGADAGSLPEVTIDSQTELVIWDEIQNSVESILNDRGRSSFSPSTGTITVSGPPALVEKIEDFLRDQNSMRLRRIAVAVKVLAVETSDIKRLAFNFQALLKNAFNDRPFRFRSIDGGLSVGIISELADADAGEFNDDGRDSVTALIESSGANDPVSEINRVSLVHSGAVMTLSDIPAPLQITRQLRFLERVSSTGGGGDAGSVSLEPGTLDIGLSLNILPRIVEKDRVLLRLAIALTDADPNFPTFGSGDIQIQLPEVETTGFLQNAVLSKGETLVIAGFEKQQSSFEERGGLPVGGIFSGGGLDTRRSREVTVLLISAEVLPEDPFTTHNY